jgi:hypothetical protein
MQHDFVTEYIVAQAKVAPADAPLAFAGLQPCKLFDLVLAAAVVRIFGEDSNLIHQASRTSAPPS